MLENTQGIGAHVGKGINRIHSTCMYTPTLCYALVAQLGVCKKMSQKIMKLLTGGVFADCAKDRELSLIRATG